MNKDLLDIHADDYGYSLNTSRDMLECMLSGKLDSISIICNMSSFEESMELLYDRIPELPFLPKMSVHLSLPEGKGISGLVPISWGKLFISSYWFNRNSVKQDLKKEIKWQIDTTKTAIEKCIDIAKKNGIAYDQKGLRIDSHIHTHPIPVVFDALVEVIEENNYEIEYIRNPKEPIIPFLKKISLIGSYGIANILKNRILMLYSYKIDRYCNYHKIDRMYMWGLMMSGHMDYDRINVLFSDMCKYSKNRRRKLELLFHPGRATKDEYSIEMNREYFEKSNLSENRNIEKKTVLNIDDIKLRGQNGK